MCQLNFPELDRKRLLQLVREHQLQLDENEPPHAVHFLNESGLFITYFSKFCSRVGENVSDPCIGFTFKRILTKFFNR